jgi:hypothetical protein
VISPKKGAGVAELRCGGVVVLSSVLAVCVVVGVECVLVVLLIWPAGTVGVVSGREDADAVEEGEELVVSVSGCGPTTLAVGLDVMVSVTVGVEEGVSGRAVAKKVVEGDELALPASDNGPTTPTVRLDVVVGVLAGAELGEMITIEMGVNVESSGEGPAVGLCLITGSEVEIVELYTLGVDAEWDAE